MLHVFDGFTASLAWFQYDWEASGLSEDRLRKKNSDDLFCSPCGVGTEEICKNIILPKYK